MLTKAKISQFHMTVTVDQNIIGFQVPMYEVDLMDRLDGQDGLSNVKTTGLFAQDILSHEQRHEITTWKKVHDKIKILIVLETVFQIDNPLILCLDEHLTLSLDVIHLILVYHFGLFHSLHGNYLSSIDMPANSDLAECASSDDGKWIEVTRRYLLPHFTVKLSLLVQNVLFDQFLLCSR